MQQILLFFLAINALLLFAVRVDAQYPPRLNIPGAIPISGPATRSRVRRPISQRAQNVVVPTLPPPRFIEETKPVTEAPEVEDEAPDVYLPTLLREQQLAQAQQAQFQQQAAAFLQNEPNSIVDSLPSLQHLQQHQDEPVHSSPRFPERSQPPKILKPDFNDYGIGSGLGSSRFERPAPTSATAPPPPPPPQRVNVVRTRLPVREQRPQYEAQYSAPAPPPPPPSVQRPRPKPIQSRPSIEQHQLNDQIQERRQKPVSQTIRKWREENEDGSITWGYENDDGSFKEELIGTDCITKGTYGYVDPDGNKREYQYETGIKCDPNTRETEEEFQENNAGFINYEENRAVLPNGIEIDMSQLGKKKSRRPGAQLRN